MDLSENDLSVMNSSTLRNIKHPNDYIDKNTSLIVKRVPIFKKSRPQNPTGPHLVNRNISPMTINQEAIYPKNENMNMGDPSVPQNRNFKPAFGSSGNLADKVSSGNLSKSKLSYTPSENSRDSPVSIVTKPSNTETNTKNLNNANPLISSSLMPLTVSDIQKQKEQISKEKFELENNQDDGKTDFLVSNKSGGNMTTLQADTASILNSGMSEQERITNMINASNFYDLHCHQYHNNYRYNHTNRTAKNNSIPAVGGNLNLQQPLYVEKQRKEASLKRSELNQIKNEEKDVKSTHIVAGTNGPGGTSINPSETIENAIAGNAQKVINPGMNTGGYNNSYRNNQHYNHGMHGYDRYSQKEQKPTSSSIRHPKS